MDTINAQRMVRIPLFLDRVARLQDPAGSEQCLENSLCQTLWSGALAYNWGLARKIAAYRAGQKVPTAIDLHRQLNMLKKGASAWLYQVSKCTPQEALCNLDQAYAHF